MAQNINVQNIKFKTNTVLTGTTNIDNNYYIILCDCISGNITLNLPAVNISSNMILIIKKIDSSVNTVTIEGNASETIDGELIHVLSTQYSSITIVCNGTSWFII